jgi:hypothetical protein
VPVTIGPILIDTLQPANTLTRIRWTFVHTATGENYRLDTLASSNPDAPITITNSTTWVAAVDEIQQFLPLSGVWNWDMEFFEATKTGPRTLYKGSITITEDITR